MVGNYIVTVSNGVASVSVPATSTGTTFNVGALSSMYVKATIGSTTQTTSVVSTPSATQNFPVSFTIPTSTTVTVDLYANISSSNGTTLVASNDTITPSLTVVGTGAQSGAAFSSTQAGQTIKAAAGTIVVARDASTPNATLVSANNTVTTAAYKFTANNDSYTISQIGFGITNSSAVQSVNLVQNGTVLQTKPAATDVIFTGFTTPITVSANTSTVLTVQLVLGNIGTGAGATGSNITTSFTAGDFQARPASTGSLVTTTSNNTQLVITAATNGNTMLAYQVIPTITLTTLPTGTLTSGTNTISKFTVQSNGTGTVAWNKIVFNVSSSANEPLSSLSNIKLWNANSNQQVLGTAVVSGLGTTGTISFYPTTEEEISGSRTYSLNADVSATVATNDYINTSIQAPTASSTVTNTAVDGTTLIGTSSATLGTHVTDNGLVSGIITGNITAGTILHATANNTTGVDWTIGSITATGFTLTSATTDSVINVATTGLQASTFTVNVTAVSAALTAATVTTSTAPTFVWSDSSAANHANNTLDWNTDYLVQTLPTNTQNLTK